MEEESTYYYHVNPMTFDERVSMYMKCDKLELAKMLAERDKFSLLDTRSGAPYIYNGTSKATLACITWNDCKNPRMDCINCPLRPSVK